MHITRLVIGALLAGLVSAQPPLRLKSVQRGPPGAHPSKRRHVGRKHWIIQFAAQPTPAQLLDIVNRGARILSYIPEFAYSISAPDDVKFDDISWAGQLLAWEKLSANLIASPAGTATSQYALVEFYPDVEMRDARAIVRDQNLEVIENSDLVDPHLLVYGDPLDIATLGAWDEVSYIFPASDDLIRGASVHACVGALTTQGLVGQSIPAFGDGWDGPGLGNANLSYAFFNQTPKLSQAAVASEVARAFGEWAKYVNVTFTPTLNPSASQTIGILFGSGNHGDAYPFIGLSVVAHTFYPFPVNPESLAGDMHFNADQNWGIGTGADIYSVALHEAGHALGLGHSDLPGAVMYPYYGMNTTLTPEDIAAVQRLYAARNTGSPPTVTPPLAINYIAPPLITSASSITIQGTASGGSAPIQVSWTSDHGLSGFGAGTANWTAGPILLTTGANTIIITVRDGTGASVAQAFTITRQTVLATPNLNILSPCSVACTVLVASASVSGTASDTSGISRVTWSNSAGLGGQATGTTAWNTGFIALQSAVNTITVKAFAQSGGSATQNVQLTYAAPAMGVDTSPPSLTILSPALTTVTTTASSIAFSGTTRDPVAVTLVTWTNSNGGSGTAVGTAIWTISPIPLLIGTNTITIRATNAGKFTAWRSVVVTRR